MDNYRFDRLVALGEPVARDRQMVQQHGIVAVTRVELQGVAAAAAVDDAGKARAVRKLERVVRGAAGGVFDLRESQTGDRAGVGAGDFPLGIRIRAEELVRAVFAADDLLDTCESPGCASRTGAKVYGYSRAAARVVEHVHAIAAVQGANDRCRVADDEVVVMRTAIDVFDAGKGEQIGSGNAACTEARKGPGVVVVRTEHGIAAGAPIERQGREVGRHAGNNKDVIAAAAVYGQFDDARQADRQPVNDQRGRCNRDGVVTGRSRERVVRRDRRQAELLDGAVVNDGLGSDPQTVVAKHHHVRRYLYAVDVFVRAGKRAGVAQVDVHHGAGAYKCFIGVRAFAAVEDDVRCGGILHLHLVVARAAGRSHHFDARIGQHVGCVQNHSGFVHDHVIVALGAKHGERVGARSAAIGDGDIVHCRRIDHQLVAAALAVESDRAVPRRHPDAVATRPARKIQRLQVLQLHLRTGSRGECRAVKRPVGVEARVEHVRAHAGVNGESARQLDIGHIARQGVAFTEFTQVASRDERAIRRRRQLIRQHGDRVVPRARIEREIEQPVSRDTTRLDRDVVVGRSGAQRDISDVEELEVRSLHPAERAGDHIGFRAGNQHVLALGHGDGYRRGHLANENIARTIGVDGGLRPAIDLRRADKRAVAIDRDSEADVVSGEAVGREQRVDRRFQHPIATLEAVGVCRAFVVTVRARASVRANDQVLAVQRHRGAEVVIRRAECKGKLLLVSPRRAAACVRIAGALAVSLVGRANDDALAADVDCIAETVVGGAVARLQGALQNPAGPIVDVDARRTMVAGCAGRADHRRMLVERDRCAKLSGQRSGGNERLRLRPGQAVVVINVGRIRARGAGNCGAAEHIHIGAKVVAYTANELRALSPGRAKALEHIRCAPAVADLRRADDQEIAAQRDAVTKAVVGLNVARLHRGLERPVAHIARIAEDAVVVVVVAHQPIVDVYKYRAAIIEIARPDHRCITVDSDGRASLALAHYLWQQQVVVDRPEIRPALPEVVHQVFVGVGVRGADGQEALADDLATGAEMQSRIGAVGPHRQYRRCVIVEIRLEGLLQHFARVVQVCPSVSGCGPNEHAVAVERKRVVGAEAGEARRSNPGVHGARREILLQTVVVRTASKELRAAWDAQHLGAKQACGVEIARCAQRRVSEVAERGAPA